MRYVGQVSSPLAGEAQDGGRGNAWLTDVAPLLPLSAPRAEDVLVYIRSTLKREKIDRRQHPALCSDQPSGVLLKPRRDSHGASWITRNPEHGDDRCQR